MEDLTIIHERNLDGTTFTPSFFSADLKDLQGFGSPEPGSGKRCFCLCGGQYLCCEGINRNLTSFQDEKMIEDVTSSTEGTPTADKPAKIDKGVQTESEEKFTLKTKNQRPLSINHNMQPNQVMYCFFFYFSSNFDSLFFNE